MRFNRTRHRAVMAMAAAGVLTALAPATAAYADDEATEGPTAENPAVADVGIRSYRGDRVVEKAYDELNSDHKYEWGNNCNFYTNVFYEPDRCHAWCADFVKYVWKNAGVYDWQQLNSEAGNTARWARHYRLWHWGTAGIFPGAAVTYNRAGDPFVDSDHVGIFVGWINGTPKVISGNFNNQVYKHNLHYGTPIAGWADPAQ